MHVIAEVTYKCPARCPFCPIDKNSKSRNMNLTHFKNALELFATLSERRLLTISGGEPTMLPHLHKFVKLAKMLDYTVTVATNCHNPEILLKAKPDFIQISIDGVEHHHNTSRRIVLWQNVLEVLKRIKEGELNGFIRYTLMRNNVEGLYLLRQKLDEMGVNVKIYAMPVRGNPELAPSKDQILMILKDGVAILPTRCPAGKGQFVITPDMQVLDCIFHRKELGRFELFSHEELEEIIRNGERLEPFPCGEPYWWSKCRSVQSAGRS